jgi:hypothetical protein
VGEGWRVAHRLNAVQTISRDSGSSSTEHYSEGEILTCLFCAANLEKEVASEKGKGVGVSN